jgi:hypothetical protein
MTLEIGFKLLTAPPHPSGGLGEVARSGCAECIFDGLREGFDRPLWSLWDWSGSLWEAFEVFLVLGFCCGFGGNWKSRLKWPASGIEFELAVRPSSGVFPDDTVPGLLLAGLMGKGASVEPGVSGRAGGVLDS